MAGRSREEEIERANGMIAAYALKLLEHGPRRVWQNPNATMEVSAIMNNRGMSSEDKAKAILVIVDAEFARRRRGEEHQLYRSMEELKALRSKLRSKLGIEDLPDEEETRTMFTKLCSLFRCESEEA